MESGMLARWRAVDENVEERDEREGRDCRYCIINVYRITRVMNIRLRPARYQ